jgi:DNA-binding CsgD family transcriptional regulator
LGSPVNQHTIVVDCGSGIIAAVSSGARGLLQKYFEADVGESSALPEEMAGWLTAQRRLLGSLDVLGGAPQCLQVRKGSSTVAVRLAQSTTNVAVILLKETDSTLGISALVLKCLTPRENEILHWIGEGKRNNEIATILSLSPRTVGKHVEHVFEKLGVETRTAAARAARDFGRVEAMNRE